ncbi:MAG: D-alanyl-D-alanine carboxypeptidase family protein [Alphaproteobacteria bacterium]|nr:D-alanyl-D-alanine carboxypeptidase family protein [Alphaproteobacteria bacterium]
MLATLARKSLLAIAFIGLATVPAAAQDVSGLETKALQAVLVDYDTGTVLLSKNADERMYPASMTKLMTAYLVFERLKNGTLSLDDTFPVSEKAWRKGGSKMFVEVGARVRVEDLLRGIIIQSGNDATIVVAEGLSGSEEAFAREMTAKAREIGMTGTQFRNASGWPDDEHYTTAHDLAVLAERIIREFPEYYHFYAETEFTYSEITQRNRNPLLYRNIGADGLKTGHTEASGYGLTASAVRNDQRLILVVNGLTSSKERALEAERVLDWGFREFGTYRLFEAGETVSEAPVWLGKEGRVPLIVQEPVDIVLRRSVRDDLKVVLHTEEPIAAPITPGTPYGEVVVSAPGLDTVRIPVVAGEPVERLGSFGRLRAALEYLVFGESG